MKLPIFAPLLVAVSIAVGSANAQQKKPRPGPKVRTLAVKSVEIGQSAIVIDETLSVLRLQASLFSDSIQRMRRGRKIQIDRYRKLDITFLFNSATKQFHYDGASW